jgi:hypothetical protein
MKVRLRTRVLAVSGAAVVLVGGVLPSVGTAATASTRALPLNNGVTKLLTIIFENHSFVQAKRSMPYLWGLGQQYAYAGNSHGNTHPSEPNYVSMLFGATLSTTNHNPALQIPGKTPFGQALDKGRTVAAYNDGMQSNCAQKNGGDRYAVKHNPWALASSERAACNKFNVPSGTITSGALRNAINSGLPTVSYLAGNLNHDWHDGTGALADAWLKGWMGKIMAGPDYTSGKLAVLITFDEDNGSPNNQILSVVVTKSFLNKHKVVTSKLTQFSVSRWWSDMSNSVPLRNAASATNMGTAFGL